MYIIVKILVTACIVTAISELAKRYSFMAAALASLPLTSILAFIWIYYESGDAAKISALSYEILWLVIPSMLFFILLPVFLKLGIKFPLALFLSCILMSGGYMLGVAIKRLFLTY